MHHGLFLEKKEKEAPHKETAKQGDKTTYQNHYRNHCR